MGSLFKARDYWKTTYPNEEFDTHSMVVENIDGDISGDPKILFGSFQGILRIVYPRQSNLKPHDLLLEHCSGLPILQLVTGNFTSKVKRAQLAILFPKKLMIAAIVTAGHKSKIESRDGDSNMDDTIEEKEENAKIKPKKEKQTKGVIDEPKYNPLDQAYALRIISEFTLEHTAYNCVVRSHMSNNTTSSDTIWIQSMDGQLTLFDHNKLTISCFIPSSDFLIPGHLVHDPMKDFIITNSSSQEINAYSYNTILKNSSSESKERGEKDKMNPDWRFITGEDVMDMCTARLSKDLPTENVEIVILCERMIYVLSDSGLLKFNKRLDVATMSVTPYFLPCKTKQNLVISTQENTIMIYSCVALEWAATVHSMALRVAIAKINNIEGMLVMLCDDGSISCNYLGTDPASAPVQLLESKILDYDEMNEEHKLLQQQIISAAGKEEPKDHMVVRVDPPSVHVPNKRCVGTLHLVYEKDEVINNIVVTINVADPIVPDQTSIVVATLPTGDSLSIPLGFTMQGTIAAEGGISMTCNSETTGRILPSSLLVEVIITYEVTDGNTLVSKTSFLIPLSFVGNVIAPIKNSPYKVQLDTNKDAPNIVDIFGDLTSMCSDEGDIFSNVLSFQFNGCGGVEDATILVSKNGGKYRVQASSLQSLWLMTSELLRRLRMYFRGCDGEELVISVPDDLPLDDYYGAIDRHFVCREELVKAQTDLGKVAHQFRAIQKRLLVRYRDRNAAPIASLEMLFETTYRHLYASADVVDKAMAALLVASNILSCSTHFILLLIRYKYQKTFSIKDLDTFKHYLSPVVTCATTSSGWEETVEAGMLELLRTVLCKTPKDAIIGGRTLELAKDTSSVKKYIGIVIGRIAKGGSVIGSEELTSMYPTHEDNISGESYTYVDQSSIKTIHNNNTYTNRNDAPVVLSHCTVGSTGIISPQPDAERPVSTSSLMT